MELIKPVLLVVVGIVVGAAFFAMGLQHRIPHWARFWQEEPIHLAIVPSGTQEGCPPSYAIDNRTDQAVILRLTDTGNAYAAEARDPRSRQFDRPYARGAAFDSAYPGKGTSSEPESGEPGIAAPDDLDPADSNYGGSSDEFGDAGTYGRGANSEDSDRGTDENSYDSRNNNILGPPPPPSGTNGSYTSPPLPPGQPLPLTPPSNSSPDGLPPASEYGFAPGYGNQPGYPQPGYAPPPTSAYGTPATVVKPGEIYFASSSENGFGRCNGASNTVTLQFND